MSLLKPRRAPFADRDVDDAPALVGEDNQYQQQAAHGGRHDEDSAAGI